MFFAVILVQSRTLLTIPASWSYKLDFVRNFKGGLRQWRNKVIFYSPDNLADPNFRLEIQNEFDPNKEACYMANILGCYYTAEDSDTYLARRRTYLPPVYTEGRISPTDAEPEFVVQVDDPLLRIKQENEDVANRIQDEFIDLTANDSNENAAEINSQNATENDLSGIDSVTSENNDADNANTNVNGPEENHDSIRETVEDVAVAQSASVVEQKTDLNENELDSNNDISGRNEETGTETDGSGNDFDRNEGASVNEIELAEKGGNNDHLDYIDQNREEHGLPVDGNTTEAHKTNECNTDFDNSTDEDCGFSVDSLMPMPMKLKAEDELSSTIPYQLRVIFKYKKLLRHELIS